MSPQFKAFLEIVALCYQQTADWKKLATEPANSFGEDYEAAITFGQNLSRDALMVHFAVAIQFLGESWENEQRWEEDWNRLAQEAKAKFGEHFLEDFKRRQKHALGGHKRHAKHNETKALIKQAWLLMGDQYGTKKEFADDMYSCFEFPSDTKSIYPWLSKWSAQG